MFKNFQIFQTFSDLKFLKSYSYIVGHILIITYEVSTYSHLCISLNRFCSIVAPISYESIFNSSNTKQLIIISWALAIFPSFYFYVYSKYLKLPKFPTYQNRLSRVADWSTLFEIQISSF